MLGSSWLGPIYDLDRRLVARARWLYLARVGFLLLLLGGLILAEIEGVRGGQVGLIQQQASTGTLFFNNIISVALTMAFLIGPTAITGSISQERARGAFDLFLATGLTSTEIVWGKLGARLWPVLGTMAVALPVVALASLMGGVDPEMLFGSFLVCCAVALFTSALAMTFAIRTVKPHEALLATYAVLFVFVVFVPFVLGMLQIFNQRVALGRVAWLVRLNPIRAAFYAGEQDFEFQIAAGSHWVDHSILIALLVGMSLLLTLWSSIRLRKIVTTTKLRKEKAARPISAREAARAEQLLDVDPVYFRECRRRRASGAMRWVWGGLICVSILSAGFAVMAFFQGDQNEVFAIVCWLLTIVGFLILAALVPTSLAEERAQGALDVLASTPLTAREIIRGKWRVNFRLVLRLGLVPILLSLLAAGVLTTDPNQPQMIMITTFRTVNGKVQQYAVTAPANAPGVPVGALPPNAFAGQPDVTTEVELRAIASSPSQLIYSSYLTATWADRELTALAETPIVAERLGSVAANSVFIAGAGTFSGFFEDSGLSPAASPSTPVSTAAPAPPFFPPGTIGTLQIFGPPPPLPRLAVSLVFLVWFLCWGALLVSLGLAVATVVHRPGRATTVNVILVLSLAVVLPTFSWIIGVDSFGSEGIATYLGPMSAAATLNLAIQQHGKVVAPAFVDAIKYGSLSAAIAATAAWLVFRWSVKRFDRSLGRAVSAKSPGPTPPARGKQAAVALATT